MAQAKIGDTVQVHYTGKLEDGMVFDSSEDRSPLQFTLGTGHVIPGFERAVIGMEQGTEKTAHIESGDAYGPHREEKLMVVERQQLPENITPEIGQQLQIRQGDGQATAVTVAEVSQNQVVLDANHPLAGRDLVFDIQLVAIV
jgi:FKBP-type peptidyl-prolyl cis-trans isomerase 2